MHFEQDQIILRFIENQVVTLTSTDDFGFVNKEFDRFFTFHTGCAKKRVISVNWDILLESKEI